MANLAVYIETGDDGHPTSASVYALAQARRICQALGATVYALLPFAADPLRLDALSQRLGHWGADRVLVCSPGLPHALPNYAYAGPLLEAVVKMLRPRLFVFPAGDAAAQLAPMLTARVMAEYLPNVSVDTMATPARDDDSPALWLRRLHSDGRWLQSLDVLQADRLVVCTVTGSDQIQFCGGRDVEVDVFSSPPPRACAVEQTESHPRGWFVSDLDTLIVDDSGPQNEASPSVMTSAHALPLWGLLCPSRLALMAAPPGAPALTLMPPDGRVGVCREPGTKQPLPSVDVVWKTHLPNASACLLQARLAPAGTKSS